jgi:hypothetical protein
VRRSCKVALAAIVCCDAGGSTAAALVFGGAVNTGDGLTSR